MGRKIDWERAAASARGRGGEQASPKTSPTYDASYVKARSGAVKVFTKDEIRALNEQRKDR